jgi:Leucine-rich repeat (LRR) protein
LLFFCSVKNDTSDSNISGNQLQQMPNFNASLSLLNLDVSSNPIVSLHANFYASKQLKYFQCVTSMSVSLTLRLNALGVEAKKSAWHLPVPRRVEAKPLAR